MSDEQPDLPASEESAQPDASEAPAPTSARDLIAATRRNNAAAMARLFAVLSFIPPIAIITGPIAVICGVVGLRHNRERPTHHGRRNSWLGIGVGSVLFVFFAAFLAKVSIVSWREYSRSRDTAHTAHQHEAEGEAEEEAE